MHEIKLIQTNDGERFETEKDAIKYLDKKFGDIICPLASKLTQVTKYSTAINFIEENLEKFRELIEIGDELNRGTERLDKGE